MAARCTATSMTAAAIAARRGLWRSIGASEVTARWMNRLDTDILILGAGGAGLFAALHAKRPSPISTSPSRSRACSANAAARAWCRAATTSRSRRAIRSSATSWTRSRAARWLNDQELAWLLVTQAPVAHPRAGERARLLLRPQSRRHDPPEGVRRADLRPHRAQGRPHRHRDHQPAGRAGLAARRAPAGGSPRARSHPGGRRLGPGGRADARHAHAANRCSCARARRCSRPAAGRRCTSITRRRATSRATAWRWRCAPACRCATWRWCSSTRPGCWPVPARA